MTVLLMTSLRVDTRVGGSVGMILKVAKTELLVPGSGNWIAVMELDDWARAKVLLPDC
ncbi:hypothetical protein HanIR_Chr01g0035011 [Helianthus annuus]|nr:hypothetical protein HanIR_Chr01g0035011 [Helianthus annuus]